MSAVVGIDLSTRALDLVRLNENDNRADWVRCELAGKDAWERTLAVPSALSATLSYQFGAPGSHWLDDVYLVAIEAPYGRGQPGTNALLNRVVGAIAASLPAQLRTPERCWIVKPDEWKNGLGLKRKPTWDDVATLTNETGLLTIPPQFSSEGRDWPAPEIQNGLDAYCMALWARDTNAKAVEKALGAA